MPTTLRVGAVNYLNTKPLIHELPELAPSTELILDVPSRLADRLAGGSLDVGLIPAIEYFRAGSYSIVPGLCIGSRAMFEAMNRAVAVNRMKPVLDRVFKFSEAREALRHMDSAAHFGKICLSV